MTDLPPGRILAIALRTAPKGPMREVPSAEVLAGRGLVGDLRVSPRRGITVLSREQWQETMAELGVDLPWHTRRANVFVEGVPLPQTVGKRIALGDVVLEVLGETRPCELMDEQYAGLQDALKPALRAGVHGRVLQGGTIRVGDNVITIRADSTTAH
jgi:MOSC domain-containing protein YiiM